MKRIIIISLFAFGFVLLAGVVTDFTPRAEFRAAAQAAPDNVHHVVTRNTFTVNVAVDCRTFVDESKRGANFIGNGKLFPAGTLPSGPASNDPTLPVNGVAPIGDWLVRGQHSLPLPVPDDLAQRYSLAPADFGTAYFIFDGGRTG
jgi:hypothetical protein